MNLKSSICLFALILWSGQQVATAAVISYNYDAAGRLIGNTYDGSTRLAYQYDRNGNLLARRAANDVIPALAATYNGLVSPPDPSSLNLGVITLKLLSNGGFSGKYTINGKSTSFRGTFNPDGSANPIDLPGGVTLTLTLDVSNGTETATGLLTIAGVDSPVVLSRSAFNAKTNPLPAGLVGKFTLLLGSAGGDPVLIPQGDGFGVGVITAAGRVRATVRLAENTGFSQSAVLSGNPAATWQFFASLYNRQGFVVGNIGFDGEAGVSDFGGAMSWLKPATTRGAHQSGFATQLTLIGSKYQPPPRGRQFLSLREGVPNAEISMSGGVLPGGNAQQDLTLNASNKWLVTAPVNINGLKIKTVGGSGLTTGSLRDGAATFRFGGVVFQKQNLISGHVLGPTQSGPMEVNSQ